MVPPVTSRVVIFFQSPWRQCWSMSLSLIHILYSPTGTMQAGGSSYNWLKGQVAKYETAVAKVQGISPYDLINAEAAKSPVGANGVLFLPYLLGERAPPLEPGCHGRLAGAENGEPALRPLPGRTGGGHPQPCLLYTSWACRAGGQR